MDRGPGDRRARGNAFYVENARAALGIRTEVRSLADVPLPLVHTALGMAVCAVVVALRPQSVGLRTAVLAAGVLAAGTAVALTLYDHVVYGRAFRHAMAAMALPVAGIAAFVVVLAGSEDLSLRIPAGAITVLVIGGVPHLGGLRAAGREGTLTRLVRDAAGVAVLAPILLASFGGHLATWSSAALAGGGVLLVTFDALLTDGLRVVSAAAAGALAGALFAGLSAVFPVAGRGTLRGAMLLLLWYGVRGLLAVFNPANRRRQLLAEYAMFVVAATAGLVWGVLHP